MSKAIMIGDRVLGFQQRMICDPHHRYRSWEHCYGFFSNRAGDYDLASLHLGFYLASWGMYRGSSFLLQKDYRIHRPAVEVLLQSKYQPLWGISLSDLRTAHAAESQSLILELVKQIKDCYADYVGHEERHFNVTDTLATKILLATLGCIPAYDRFFIAGLKHEGLKFSYLNSKNFAEMLAFCHENEADFIAVQEAVSKMGFHYPIMKIIDMYFFSVGLEMKQQTS